MLTATSDVERNPWDVLVIYLVNPQDTPVIESGHTTEGLPVPGEESGRGVSLSLDKSMLPKDLDNTSNKSTRLGSVKATLPIPAKFKFSCVATFTAILAAPLNSASIKNPSEYLYNPRFNFSLDAFQPLLVSLRVIHFLTGRMTIINLSLSINHGH